MDIATLKQELETAYPYRIELHAHTKPVSGCSEIPPEELVERYHALGADAVVITNHFTPNSADTPAEEWKEYYLSGYRETKEYAKRYGMTVLLGIEMRFADCNNDYLVYGVNEDFVSTAWHYTGGDLHTFYTACKTPDNVIVQAHPFRDGMQQRDPADMDGIEVFNMHPNHNSRVGFAARHAREHGGIITGGTDFHHRGHEGCIFCRTATLPQTSEELAKILISGDYLFEIGGTLVLK